MTTLSATTTSTSPAQAVRSRLAAITAELEELTTQTQVATTARQEAAAGLEAAEVGVVVGTHDAAAVTAARAALDRATEQQQGLLDRRALLDRAKVQLEAQQTAVELEDLSRQMRELEPAFRAHVVKLGAALDAASAAYHEALPVAGKLAQLSAAHLARSIGRVDAPAAPVDEADVMMVLGWGDCFSDRGAGVAGSRPPNHADRSRLGRWRAACRERKI